MGIVPGVDKLLVSLCLRPDNSQLPAPGPYAVLVFTVFHSFTNSIFIGRLAYHVPERDAQTAGPGGKVLANPVLPAIIIGSQYLRAGLCRNQFAGDKGLLCGILETTSHRNGKMGKEKVKKSGKNKNVCKDFCKRS